MEVLCRTPTNTPQYRSSFRWERDWRLRRCAVRRALRIAEKNRGPPALVAGRLASRLRRLSNPTPASFEDFEKRSAFATPASSSASASFTTASSPAPLALPLPPLPHHSFPVSWTVAAGAGDTCYDVCPSIAVCEGTLAFLLPRTSSSVASPPTAPQRDSFSLLPPLSLSPPPLHAVLSDRGS